MFRIEDKYGKTIAKVTERNVAMKMAIEFGKNAIDELIDYSDLTGSHLNGDIGIDYYPESGDLKDYALFVVYVGYYDDEHNYAEQYRYEVVFEG